MPKFGSRARVVSVGAAVLAGLAGIVGVVIFASPAGAWHATVHGSAKCDSSTGSWTVTYEGTSTNAGTVTVKSVTPQTAYSPTSQHVGDNGPFTIIQTGVPSTATEASITVHVAWDEQSTENGDFAASPVPLTGPCTKAATAAQPTFNNGTCTTPQPSYTIPDVEGVAYEVNGAVVAPGTHPAQPGDSITIEASAKSGYTLGGSTSKWQFTFAALPTNCAAVPTDTMPSCASPHGSYTIPATEGVTYFVNGQQTAAGTYTAKAGSTVEITAFGSNGQALPGASSWTFRFPAATGCTAHVPAFADNTCSRQGSYTIPGTTNAHYSVNGVAVSTGTHRATAGTTLTIRASAQPGHTLAGVTAWTHTFPDLPQCAADSPPHSPNAGGSLPNTGPDVPVGKASLLAGLLALVGTALLYAGRKPSPSGRHSAR
jgi:hypothetical protein